MAQIAFHSLVAAKSIKSIFHTGPICCLRWGIVTTNHKIYKHSHEGVATSQSMTNDKNMLHAYKVKATYGKLK